MNQIEVKSVLLKAIVKDFYYILGLDANCTLDEIEEAYGKLSKQFRLDLNHSYEYFKNRFTEINEAYAILTDPVKRVQYDKALKEAKSNPVNEEFKRRQYYREHPELQPHHTLYLSFKTNKTKGPGIGINVAFIIVAALASIYFAESRGNSKAHQIVSPSEVRAVSYKIPAQYKKKHILNNKNARDSSKLHTGNTVAKPVQRITINKSVVADNNKQTVPANHTKTGNAGNYLYTAFVSANITGVVNLRKSANYSSPVIKVIPTNSKVLVIAKGYIYDKVSYNHLVGYIPKWLLH